MKSNLNNIWKMKAWLCQVSGLYFRISSTLFDDIDVPDDKVGWNSAQNSKSEYMYSWHWPVDAAAEGDEEVGEGGDLLQPLGGLRLLGGVELTELPGVGHPADAVTQDKQAHDGQADLGLAHLNNIYSELWTNILIIFWFSLFTSLPPLLMLTLSPTILLILRRNILFRVRKRVLSSQLNPTYSKFWN